VDREALLAEHGEMVETIARTLRKQLALDVDLRDLIHDGHVGLIEAADRYDPDRGTPRGAFTYWRVRGAMIDGLRRMGRVPRRTHDRLQREAAVQEAIERDQEARQHENEVSALGADGEVAGPIDRRGAAIALDEMLSGVAAAFTAMALEQREGREDPEQELITEIELHELREAMKTLSPREQRAVRGRFFESLTQDVLAVELEVSRSRVSQIITEALAQLRDQLK
jgi:RNA polymerase sigma factor for flagellar operon FliA